MQDGYVVVSGYVNRGDDSFDLRRDVWSMALDQRAFGPRRLVVAFSDADGAVLSLAHVERTDPPEDGLDPCIRHLGLNAAAAVAFCDEPVSIGPPPSDVAPRFAAARRIAAGWGVHLVDWFACDDDIIRSSKLAGASTGDWWDVPRRG